MLTFTVPCIVTELNFNILKPLFLSNPMRDVIFKRKNLNNYLYHLSIFEGIVNINFKSILNFDSDNCEQTVKIPENTVSKFKFAQ